MCLSHLGGHDSAGRAAGPGLGFLGGVPRGSQLRLIGSIQAKSGGFGSLAEVFPKEFITGRPWEVGRPGGQKPSEPRPSRGPPPAMKVPCPVERSQAGPDPSSSPLRDSPRGRCADVFNPCLSPSARCPSEPPAVPAPGRGRSD